MSCLIKCCPCCLTDKYIHEISQQIVFPNGEVLPGQNIHHHLEASADVINNTINAYKNINNPSNFGGAVTTISDFYKKHLGLRTDTSSAPEHQTMGNSLRHDMDVNTQRKAGLGVSGIAIRTITDKVTIPVQGFYNIFIRLVSCGLG